jgi:hypothetical protein
MDRDVTIRQNNTIAINIREITFIGIVDGGVKYVCLSQDDQLIKVEPKFIAELADAIKSFETSEPKPFVKKD